MKKPQKPIESAIHHAGGVTRLASAIGVTQSAISNWKARGTMPNATYCSAIERATNGVVTRRDLRPQDWHLIWPELAALSEKEEADFLPPSPLTAMWPDADAQAAKARVNFHPAPSYSADAGV